VISLTELLLLFLLLLLLSPVLVSLTRLQLTPGLFSFKGLPVLVSLVLLSLSGLLEFSLRGLLFSFKAFSSLSSCKAFSSLFSRRRDLGPRLLRICGWNPDKKCE
jgi:hypothetical protein